MRDLLNEPNSPQLRARVRIALGLQPMPTFDVPFFILPAPKAMLRLGAAWTPAHPMHHYSGPADAWGCDFSQPFWALRGGVHEWWNSFQLRMRAQHSLAG